MKLLATASDRRRFLILLALAVVVLLAAAASAARGVDLGALAKRYAQFTKHYAEFIGRAGPWAFFGAMALLPAVGFPILAFTLTAGPAFSSRLGMPGVVLAALSAVTVNMLLTYWLARRALRPWLSRLLPRLGYSLPKVPAADMTDLIVILRVTPGPPFFVQNYLLGLADAPLGRYLAVSCTVTWAYNATGVVFGDALAAGRGKMIAAAVGLFLGIAVVAHLVRRHYAGRKKAP